MKTTQILTLMTTQTMTTPIMTPTMMTPPAMMMIITISSQEWTGKTMQTPMKILIITTMMKRTTRIPMMTTRIPMRKKILQMTQQILQRRKMMLVKTQHRLSLLHSRNWLTTMEYFLPLLDPELVSRHKTLANPYLPLRNLNGLHPAKSNGESKENYRSKHSGVQRKKPRRNSKTKQRMKKEE